MSSPKNDPDKHDTHPVRLQKFLSQAGVSSRRKAEELILEGRVRVNGEVVRKLGTRVDPIRDSIAVDGKKVRPKELRYVILHKPPGVVSSRQDPQKRPTVIDMLPRTKIPLYPVGRLDYNASGLILLTNDGDAAMALTHPSFKTPRTYLVKVKGRPDEKDLSKLRRGVRLDGGSKTLPAKVERTEVRRRGRPTTANTWLKFIIREGRNRQIKRMCMAVRHPALSIQRVAMGPLKLGALPQSAWRYATPNELKELKRLAQTRQARSASRRRSD